MDPSAFRAHLRRPDDPRIAGLDRLDAYTHADRMLAHPVAGRLFSGWRERYESESFRGISNDGQLQSGLFALADEGAPVLEAHEAAERLLAALDPGQRALLCHPLDAREWHGWMNPEVYMMRFGLRLEEVSADARTAMLELLRASLSPAGFTRVRDLMRVNRFLGELVQAPRVLNEFSYNLNLFGTPSPTEPWGWNFYGHHVCLNCRFVGPQMTLTPVFMGAEPNGIDRGPDAGLSVFVAEERLALDLMRGLPPALQARARLYERKRDPGMPPGRVALGDELHLAGAFQDNRVVPYEGVPVADFDEASASRLMALVASHLADLPDRPLAARLAQVAEHLHGTHFCWIGGFDDSSPFYYRIQSPVILIEFDHHAGVFLGNAQPERFHIHTLVRTPNGNDYGMELVRQHCTCSRRARFPGQEGPSAT